MPGNDIGDIRFYCFKKAQKGANSDNSKHLIEFVPADFEQAQNYRQLVLKDFTADGDKKYPSFDEIQSNENLFAQLPAGTFNLRDRPGDVPSHQQMQTAIGDEDKWKESITPKKVAYVYIMEGDHGKRASQSNTGSKNDSMSSMNQH